MEQIDKIKTENFVKFITIFCLQAKLNMLLYIQYILFNKTHGKEDFFDG